MYLHSFMFLRGVMFKYKEQSYIIIRFHVQHLPENFSSSAFQDIQLSSLKTATNVSSASSVNVSVSALQR